MEENTTIEQENLLENEQELTLMEKLTGVITSPSKTFESIAKFPAKASDWVIPAILLMLASMLTVIVININPTLKEKVMDQQMTKIEEQLDKKVEAGSITQEQADKQMEFLSDQMDKSGSYQIIFQIIGIVIVTFIIILIVGGIFYLIAKFGMKGEGNYLSALIGYSLPLVISFLQVLVILIVTLALGHLITTFSLGTLFGTDSSTFGGFLLKKIDPFSIWFFYVVGVAYAKLFKAEKTTNYVIMVYAVWIISFLAFYFITKAIPFAANFNL